MRRKRNFTERLAWTYILIIFLVLSLSFIGFYNMLTKRTSDEIDTTISSYSLQLSLSSSVSKTLEDGVISQEFSDYLDEIIDKEKYVDYIVICNTDSIRLFHPNKLLVGERFQGGDEGEVLEGKSYITNGKGTREYQRRSFNPIYDKDGSIKGFIMVSCYTKSINQIYRTELERFVFIYIGSLLVGIVFSFMIAQSLRKVLLGYEPAHIAEMFIQREDILNSLNEGLVLLNKDNKVEYMNTTAKSLISAGENKSEEEIERIMNDELKIGTDEIQQKQFKRNDTNIMVSVGSISHQEREIGKLVLIDDMTNLIKTAEELTGFKHVVEALRATTHEQKNRLHVILGLLQLGETYEAIHYITDSISSEETHQSILNSIENKTIAALILGKMNRAKELDITFQLVKDSYLDKHNAYLSTQDLVTIIGNLIENGFDALEQSDDEKKVELFVRTSDEGLIIIVDDNGPGMSSEIKEKILKERFSTKGDNRGTGLTLIRNIVDRTKGSFTIDTEPGEGSSFTVLINEKRIGYRKDNQVWQR